MSLQWIVDQDVKAEGQQHQLQAEDEFEPQSLIGRTTFAINNNSYRGCIFPAIRDRTDLNSASETHKNSNFTVSLSEH